jgi:hypothetical protein
MVKAVGGCKGNIHAVAILHAESFPRQHHPDDIVNTRVEQQLVDAGHLNP